MFHLCYIEYFGYRLPLKSLVFTFIVNPPLKYASIKSHAPVAFLCLLTVRAETGLLYKEQDLSGTFLFSLCY